MEEEIDRVVQAITIASDPSQTSLHQQAMAYLNSIERNASESWRLALPLFAETTSGGARKYSDQVRFFALRVLNEYLDNRFAPLDSEAFQIIQQSILSYIQSEYVYGSAEANATYIRNKFSHTLTLFFLCTYVGQWESFFTDLFALIRPATSSDVTFNRHVSLLFFHLIVEISGEVADQMIKAARMHNPERLARDGRVRDAVRERDAVRINEAVLTIVAEATEKMSMLRNQGSNSPPDRQLADAEEVVDWGIRTFASFVGWIDIGLTVTPVTVPLLFSLLSDPFLPIRLATSGALLKIVTKGLKEPGDKLQLIKVLSLGQVIEALEAKTRAQQRERGEDTDEGEESYRESLGRVLNALGLELTKLEECPLEEVRTEANNLLQQILPIILRFMSDEYDDTCSTVFLLLHTILSAYKRFRKVSTAPIDADKRDFLASLLRVILEKMKWDVEADPSDVDDDDNDEFERLRKVIHFCLSVSVADSYPEIQELRIFMDSVLAIDQDLVTDAVRQFALTTIETYKNGVEIKWNEAELGIYLVYIFGEINKTGGKGRAAFCLAPAIPKDVPRDARKSIDYGEYPLTIHGELLFALVQSGMSAYPHQTVALQFFETVSRYSDFFKVRKECVVPTLEAMIDTRGIHHQNPTFRRRVYYLFHRFIKESKNDIPLEFVPNISQSIRDLLAIEVLIPEPDEVEVDFLTDAVKSSSFDAQLYLFETLGILISLLFKNPPNQKGLLLSFVKPLMDDLSGALQGSASLDFEKLASGGSRSEIVPVVRLHHLIMALGSIAKGFPDYPSPLPDDYIMPPVDLFAEIAQAILVCLENTNTLKVIRDATRFAFARILAIAGPHVTHYIPPLMGNLLIHFDPSELVDFMNFIGLLIFRLQDDMFNVLDELVGPLTAHISFTLSQPISGSDEQRMHVDIKKAYIALLTSVMNAKLQGVFISPRNNASFDSLMETMQILAEDTSDPPNQRAMFSLLSKCILIWVQPNSALPAPNGNSNHNPLNDVGIPGFERYVYERLVPIAFGVPSLPDLNLKDGQVTMILHEIANFLQSVSKIRGSETENYLLNVYFPSQNWPQDAALDMTTKMRELDPKGFRKYFTDFVRSMRSGS
ncbi:armadillo-type protein [Lentinula boryana]|uniref:Exportin-T n=1 Tax=Lentinula boryana TaxID=40481 RepID=A0ABQ8QLY9_9AGAR|nr:armadillo-type protein [Lentinula boryana]